MSENKRGGVENLPKNSLPIAIVYETTDYDWFKFIKGNRTPDHVKALILSFKEHYVPNAILCNEKGEIIDGQNRFLANKELGKPIQFYLIEGLGVRDIASTNSYAKNWGLAEFVSLYATLGLEDYQKAISFSNAFPDFSMQSILALLSDNTNVGKDVIYSDEAYADENRKKKTSMLSTVKSGTFKVKNLEKATTIACSLLQYKPLCRNGEKFYKSPLFVNAMISLYRQPWFNNKEMVQKVKNYPDMFYPCQRTSNYINMMVELWNRNRKKDRVQYVKIGL